MSTKTNLVLLRLIQIFFVWPAVSAFFSLERHSRPVAWYDLLAAIFYLLLFGVIRQIISSKAENVNDTVSAYLGKCKWIFTLLALVLVSLSTWSGVIRMPVVPFRDFNTAMLYYLHVFGPSILVPNMGFIAISGACWYIVELLDAQKRMKEEQELTI